LTQGQGGYQGQMQYNMLTKGSVSTTLDNKFKELSISHKIRNFLDTYRNNVNSDIESIDTKEIT
jgi:hypothetical protein